MLRVMSRRALQLSAVSRASMIARHVSTVSGSAPIAKEPLVLFESDLAARTYVLNRPSKLNALDHDMVKTIRAKIQEWDAAQLSQVIVGVGNGRAFCAGGDIITVMEQSKAENSREKAIEFFKDEFEMNFLLGNLSKPYVAIMDGITMGGGVGLSVHAPFRVATENTVFSMPETKIGYFPDVGSNHFLSRLDGELGTYFALTGARLTGRAVFEHGIATHYIPARRIPDLRSRLSSLERATPDLVDAAIEELHFEKGEKEPPAPFVGDKRIALDTAFSKDTVEDILSALESLTGHDNEIAVWAKATIVEMKLRSPTSLKVALQAIRQGRGMTLGEVLQMEMGLATAFINGATPDFVTGVTALLDKTKERPKWTPETLSGVSEGKVIEDFYTQKSPFRDREPQLSLPSGQSAPWRNYALPSEDEIGKMVLGSHRTSGGTGLTLADLVNRFDRLRSWKHGVKEKVLEVASRRCREYKDPEKQGCLEWVH